MTKHSRSDDETRSGFRSGEGTQSVLHHLMASRRRQRDRAGTPDSHLPTQPMDGADSELDIQLPP